LKRARNGSTRPSTHRRPCSGATRSLFELRNVAGDFVDLHFGPAAPKGNEERWIKTIPGKGWFVYFRIYAAGRQI